jgi:hypothetical protein
MQKECQASSPNQGLAISADLYKRACQPGADVRAVFERVSQIGLLQMAEVLTPWLQDGVPNDAVFDVIATIQMNRMQVGTVYNKMPFDVDEFLKQVEQRTRN